MGFHFVPILTMALGSSSFLLSAPAVTATAAVTAATAVSQTIWMHSTAVLAVATAAAGRGGKHL